MCCLLVSTETMQLHGGGGGGVSSEFLEWIANFAFHSPDSSTCVFQLRVFSCVLLLNVFLKVFVPYLNQIFI